MQKDINLKGSQAPPIDSVIQSIASNTIELRILQGHSIFIGLKYLVPEDILWRRENPNTPAMICLQKSNVCPCNFSCMSKFATRCHWLFERFPDAKQIFMLFKRNEEKDLNRGEDQPGMRRDDIDNYKMALGMKPGKRVIVPRLYVVHINRQYNIKPPLRVNYDALQNFMFLSTPQIVQVPSLF